MVFPLIIFLLNLYIPYLMTCDVDMKCKFGPQGLDEVDMKWRDYTLFFISITLLVGYDRDQAQLIKVGLTVILRRIFILKNIYFFKLGVCLTSKKNKKTRLITINHFLFSVFKNKKWGIFKKCLLIIFYCFVRAIVKKIII